MTDRDSADDPRSGYRGRDRRLQPFGSAGGDLVIAGAVALVVAWAIAIAASLTSQADATTAIAVRGVLDAVAATIAGIAGTLGLLHWRLVGITRSLWSGAAFVVLAGFAVPALGAPAGVRAGSALLALRLALTLSALLILAFGAARPPVDVSIRPVMVIGGASLATVVIVSVLTIERGLAATLGRRPSTVAVGFLAVSVAYSLRLRRDQHAVDPWRCLALVGIASSLGAAHLARNGTAVWTIAEGALLVLAMALMAVGTSRALLLAYASQRRELVASALVAEDLDARSRAQRHDVTNALVGLGGAAATLERFHDRLNPTDRDELTRSLTREVSRLQAIIDQATAQHAPFPLASAVPETDRDPIASVVVPPELLALGDLEATRGVVRTLVEQASERTAGGGVEVRAERDGDWVVLRVTDSGPGIPRGDRRTLFSRSGTPMAEAARAMRRQGGDLWVDGHGNQTSFALCLPRAAGGPETGLG